MRDGDFDAGVRLLVAGLLVGAVLPLAHGHGLCDPAHDLEAGHLAQFGVLAGIVGQGHEKECQGGGEVIKAACHLGVGKVAFIGLHKDFHIGYLHFVFAAPLGACMLLSPVLGQVVNLARQLAAA